MTVLYEFLQLEDKSSPQLKFWKAWHIAIYAFIAVCGIINYTCLENTKQFVDDHCIFYPYKLAFHMVEVEVPYERRKNDSNAHGTGNEIEAQNEEEMEGNAQSNRTEGSGLNATKYGNDTLAQESQVDNAAQVDTQSNKENNDNINRGKREVVYRNDTTDSEITIEVDNVTVVVENRTHRLKLDTTRSYFVKDSECQYAEFTPLVSTIFAMVWMVLYMMCPGDGRQTSGLQQPWRILAPALIFAVVLFCLTGSSFVQTNGGIQAFCAAFYNYTNSTGCSSIEPYLHHNSSHTFATTAGLTRGSSAAVWAGWACTVALVVARFARAPDFTVKRTAVVLTSDPNQKLTPYLKKSGSRSPRPSPRAPASPPSSPDASVKSEPTHTSQVVTATVETGLGSPVSLGPASLEDSGEVIEMRSVLPKEVV